MKERYDAHCKRLLSHKPILARIMKGCMEAQNRFKPGYPLVRRGVYYASRLISAQGRTEVKNERYDSLKKVYSVWICTVPPAELRNTIVEFRLGRSVLAGTVPDDAFIRQEYDLLSVIFVNLGGRGGENPLLAMLNLLLLDSVSPDSGRLSLR